MEGPEDRKVAVAARIDRLAPDDKRLLQTASVIGNDVPLALLEAIAEMPESSLRRSLARLSGGSVAAPAGLGLVHDAVHNDIRFRAPRLRGRLLDLAQGGHLRRRSNSVSCSGAYGHDGRCALFHWQCPPAGTALLFLHPLATLLNRELPNLPRWPHTMSCRHYSETIGRVEVVIA